MELQTWISGLLVLASVFPPAEALALYDPQLCYVLDGFLGLYGLIITGMFIREKFFRTKAKATDESIYSVSHQTQQISTVVNSSLFFNTVYGTLWKLSSCAQRHRKNEQVYQGLSTATKDTYDSLQMKPLSAR
uniref:T-cell surface glycoprotein CD3 zeta chain n=1 Tax=Dicentrarchus labrax TaxID=13489 RepID=A0A8C4F8A3_DICLA